MDPRCVTLVDDEALGISSMIPLIKLLFPPPTGPQTAKTSPLRTVKSKPDTVNIDESLLLSASRSTKDALDCEVTMKEACSSFSAGASGSSVAVRSILLLPDDWTLLLPCRIRSARVSRRRNSLTRLTAESACANSVFFTQKNVC